MNLQKISLPEIHGSSNKTFTILECLPRHLHHLRISPQSTSTVSGYLYSPPPFSWNVSPDICTISDVFAIHSIIFGYLLGRLYHISPRPISGHRHQHCMAQNPAMRSCNSPGSGYPSTDTCGYGSACRYPHFGGTWQQGYRHTYLYWHIDCQVNCTKDHDERPAWMKYTSSPAGMHLD